MTRCPGSGKGNIIGLAQWHLKLHTKVELIAADIGCVQHLHGANIAGTATAGNATCVVAPQVRQVGTHTQGLEQTDTGTDKQLVQTSIAGKGSCHLGKIGVAKILSLRIIISDVRVRQHTKSYAHALKGTELTNYIVETTTLTTQFTAVFLIIGNLTRESGIKQHRERVDGRIRCGVRGVYLVTATHGQAHAVHTFIKSYTLISQIA